MTDTHEQLRSAAIRVLNTANHQQLPEPLVQVLHELHRAVVGDISTDAAPDPSKHYLGSHRYIGKEKFPITLGKKAADWRRQLDNDRGIADTIPGHPTRNVQLTELRGMIIGSLLNELATRLSPGAAFGPARDGLALATISRQLSNEILDQTFIGCV